MKKAQYLWFFLLTLLGVALFACSRPDAEATVQKEVEVTKGEVGFVHTVFFWLKEDASQAQRDQLIDDCYALLGSIESVQILEAGPPAGTPRDVVDNSYDVALAVHFADVEGHDIYQEAQAHLEFIDRNQDSWERVQVYDFQPSR